MLSKAAYHMQDHIRRNYALLSDIAPPAVFMARGRQHFPQGLHAIAKIFGGRLPAHVYAHRYFMEKQSDPSQPSPQLHITEESQGILKIMGGMRYMRDSSSKLDGTVVVITDYNVSAKGRMLCVHEDDLKAAQGARGSPSPRPSSRGKGRGRSTGFSGPGGGIGVGGGGFQGAMNASHGKHLGGAANEPPVFPSPDDDESSGNMVDQSKSYRFFHVALYPRAAPATLHDGKVKDPDAFEPLFREKEGGFTVLYSPVEVSDKTFADLIHKLHEEERVVAAIVLPTTHAWRHVQLWADAFPDAKILSSTAVPLEQNPEDTPEESHAAPEGWTGGCQDMGDGITGLTFPEVDEAELQAAQMPTAAPATDAAAGDPEVPHQRQAPAPPPGSYAFSSSIPFTSSLGNMDKEDELVDSILLSPGEMYLKQFVGLRREDAHRVEVLVPDADTAPPAVYDLTPALQLRYIPGDPTAHEYVLYDKSTQTLACTDLFHGEYSDLDPVNSWLCRVWFKFMKRGNHKRTDVVPRDKWLALRHAKGASLDAIRAAVDDITRTLPIRLLLYAHGTPPLANNPANALRHQMRSRRSIITNFNITLLEKKNKNKIAVDDAFSVGEAAPPIAVLLTELRAAPPFYSVALEFSPPLLLDALRSVLLAQQRNRNAYTVIGSLAPHRRLAQPHTSSPVGMEQMPILDLLPTDEADPDGPCGSGEGYVSPLAIVADGVRFSPGCVVLPGARVSLHVLADESPDVAPPPEGAGASGPVMLLFSPYTLIEEYAEINVYARVGVTKETKSTEGQIIVFGSHNRFKSYARLYVEGGIGSGNIFYPYATVDLRLPPGREEQRIAIGDHCRFAARVHVIPRNIKDTPEVCTGAPSSGAARTLHHCSLLLGAPAEESDDEEKEKEEGIVWVVPTGGARSTAEPPTPAGSAFLEEAQRNCNEVEQMCEVYIELYGMAPALPLAP
eukprot:gene10702-7434_t